MDDGVGGEAGREQDGEAGAGLQCGVGEAAAVHPRHDDVGEEKVDARVGGNDGERGVAVGGLERGVAQRLERGQAGFAHRGFVLDDEHGLAIERARELAALGLAGDLARLRGARGAGQVELDRGAFALFGIEREMAARLLEEAEDLAEAEAGALADLLGGEEGIDGLDLDLLAHAAAGVGDGDEDELALGRVLMFLGIGAVEVAVDRLDGEASAVGHGVARVDREVGDGVFELRGVDRHGPQPAREDGFQLDMVAERAAQQLGHFADEAVAVDRFGQQRLAAREGEEALGEFGGLVGAEHGAGERLVALVGIRAALRHVDIAGDDREHVVEVVRDAARELSDRLHLLHVTNLRLGLGTGARLGDELGVGGLQVAGAGLDLPLHPEPPTPLLEDQQRDQQRDGKAEEEGGDGGGQRAGRVEALGGADANDEPVAADVERAADATRERCDVEILEEQRLG